jgi:hypothetical protein
MDQFPLLSCLAGLVLVKVDDLDSHQALYKGSFLDEEDRSSHGGLYEVVTYFTGPAERAGLSHRIETSASRAPHRLHTRALRRRVHADLSMPEGQSRRYGDSLCTLCIYLATLGDSAAG